MKEIEISRETWGSLSNGLAVEKYKIAVPEKRFDMTFTNLGASILQVRMADRNKNVHDIHYGRLTPEALFQNTDNAYLGSIVGRVASTIPFAQFKIDGTEYRVTPNMMGVHSQHGGRFGFNTKIWKCVKFETQNSEKQVVLQFSYTSIDGEEGYPGNLNVIVTYSLTNDLTFSWDIRATTDKATIVNIINHAYWNPEGVGKTVYGLELQLNASKYMLIDMKKMIVHTLLRKLHLSRKPQPFPYSIRECEMDGFGFKHLRNIGAFFAEKGDLDHNFLIDRNESASPAAVLYSPATGRKMTFTTGEPAIIVYSGNYMAKVTSIQGQCVKHAAICLETARPTNSINIPEFKDWVILRPSEEYVHHTEIRFSIE